MSSHAEVNRSIYQAVRRDSLTQGRVLLRLRPDGGLAIVLQTLSGTAESVLTLEEAVAAKEWLKANYEDRG